MIGCHTVYCVLSHGSIKFDVCCVVMIGSFCILTSCAGEVPGALLMCMQWQQIAIMLNSNHEAYRFHATQQRSNCTTYLHFNHTLTHAQGSVRTRKSHGLICTTLLSLLCSVRAPVMTAVWAVPGLSAVEALLLLVGLSPLMSTVNGAQVSSCTKF